LVPQSSCLGVDIELQGVLANLYIALAWIRMGMHSANDKLAYRVCLSVVVDEEDW
jgi:hypothetical protein